MNTSQTFKFILRSIAWPSAVLATSAALVACGGGGGGGAPLPPEAVVQSVASGQVLEGQPGQAGKSLVEFLVTLNKPVERGLVVSFNTSSTAKTGVASTGSATGGVCATSGVDYVTAANSQITIPPGLSTYKLTVEVCPDAVFEPNETFNLTWSSAGAVGDTKTGTIVNDDVGGLNGTGATTLLGGLTAFGRDANPLTNSAADGALGFSFDKTSACVVDKVTGLTWQKLPVPVTSKAYADLPAYVTSVNDCGHTDWRLPTVNELLGLMDASQTTTNPAPPLNADALGVAGDVMKGKFWSAEERSSPKTLEGWPSDVWFVDASNGGAVSYMYIGTKTTPPIAFNVRLVRGGSNYLACDNGDARFTDLGDATVADKVTGLMWKKCPESLISDTDCAASPALSYSAASQVVDRLKTVNDPLNGSGLGYSDWRVPTRNELASLVKRSCTTNPAIVPNVFPGSASLNLVSATLDADAPATRVWSVNFAEGSIGQIGLTGPLHLRLVRAGQ
jgi:hypothetical protein